MLSYMPWLARAVEGGELRSITLGHPLLDVFSGDLPRLDDPLPRFLDDGAAMKLLQAARSDEDPLCAWADAEGAEMLKLRRETHQRMLGNGYCARPVELYCHFESICESCTFFVTTIEFKPTLQRQRDDAAGKGQVGRQKVFDGLLARLGEEAS